MSPAASGVAGPLRLLESARRRGYRTKVNRSGWAANLPAQSREQNK